MINVLCIGGLKENYLKQAQEEYLKRIRGFTRISVTEKKEAALPRNASDALIEKAVKQESDELLASSKGYVIALSPEGKSMTSPGFASMMKERTDAGDISFLIGGSSGLHDNLKAKANLVLSFSDMTMPHQLFRIVLLEQVYRSFMINNQRTYHK